MLGPTKIVSRWCRGGEISYLNPLLSIRCSTILNDKKISTDRSGLLCDSAYFSSYIVMDSTSVSSVIDRRIGIRSTKFASSRTRWSTCIRETTIISLYDNIGRIFPISG